jgi:hypothetical protein
MEKRFADAPQFTREVKPEIVQRPQSNVMYSNVEPSQMMYQRPMMQRNMQRDLPNLSNEKRVRSIENPTVQANLSLAQMTPEAVLKSRDLRTTVTQRSVVSERGAPEMMKTLNPMQVSANPNADRRILMGLEESFVRTTKRTNAETLAFDTRQIQDASLHSAQGMNYLSTSQMRQAPNNGTLFASQSFGHSNEELTARSDVMFKRSTTNNIPYDDPRLLSSPIGAGVVRHSGVQQRPLNSRR